VFYILYNHAPISVGLIAQKTEQWHAYIIRIVQALPICKYYKQCRFNCVELGFVDNLNKIQINVRYVDTIKLTVGSRNFTPVFHTSSALRNNNLAD
jgi:hypothetical protein